MIIQLAINLLCVKSYSPCRPLLSWRAWRLSFFQYCQISVAKTCVLHMVSSLFLCVSALKPESKRAHLSAHPFFPVDLGVPGNFAFVKTKDYRPKTFLRP